MAQPQLMLIQNAPEVRHTPRRAKTVGHGLAARSIKALPHATADVVRVFEHWVDMLGKNPKRCALGPTRRKVIARALDLYDEDTVLLAIEGCATSPFHLGENDRGHEYTDLELILRDEAHVEKFAALGEAARERAEQDHQRQIQAQRAAAMQAAGGVADVASAEQAQAARDRLRELQRRIAAEVGVRGGGR